MKKEPEAAKPKPVEVKPKPDHLKPQDYDKEIQAFETQKNIGVQLVGTDKKTMPGQQLEVTLNGNGEINNKPEKAVIKTDDKGIAYFDLKAGKKIGDLKTVIRCQNPEFKHVKTELDIIIIPNEPEKLEIQNNLQAYTSGKKLPKPIKVLVHDRFGNPVSSRPVHFRVTMGDGMFDNDQKMTTSTTNENGEIIMDFTLGNEPGFNAVDIKVGESGLGKAFQAVGQD